MISFNLALCSARQGKPSQARRELSPLVSDPALDSALRERARQELAQVEATLAHVSVESAEPGHLGDVVSYVNSKGEAWRSTVGDILTHVVLHSSYHRGQIASHVRATGAEPAYTDFIHATRTGLVP